jgi:hypothetical protein
MPAQLCRWALHVTSYDYYDTDDEDEESLAYGTGVSFVDTLCHSLALSKFSNIDFTQFPLAIPHIAAAASRSPDSLLLEAVGFAVVSRNTGLLHRLLKKVKEQEVDLSELYPYHLAATYLDGAEACCHVLEILMTGGTQNTLAEIYTNDLGHTVLDSLFIAVLRSHTSMSPSMIDPVFLKENRLPGEELDVCGRWDADSECYLKLLAAGQVKVPTTWKHKFCHTSVQAVSHFIHEISYGSITLATRSGLSRRLCPSCGLMLQLLPLHSLVLVGYNLLHFGLDGEDLFGVVCCLFELLSAGLNAEATSELSISLLLDLDPGTICSHGPLTPAAFAELLPTNVERTSPEQALLGWSVFLHILRLAESNVREYASEFSLELGHGNEDVENAQLYEFCAEVCMDFSTINFSKRSPLGSIWAAAQTEFLTYRRQEEGESWMSGNFDMGSVLRGLLEHKPPSMPLTNLMNPYCFCGRFGCGWQPRVKEAAAFDFSNMHNCDRQNFIYDGY